MDKYDILIIGAGCAGLSLAYKLIDSDLKICVLEKFARTKRIRKTWSYWDTYKHNFIDLESNRYEELEIKKGESVLLNCSNNKYVSIDSQDFDDYIIPKLDEASKIDLIFDSDITDVYKSSDGYCVESNGKHFFAKKVFDSRQTDISASLYQVFHGYFIKPKNNIKLKPKLMDFTEQNEFHFFYVLPKDDESILVESTYFSKKVYPEEEMKQEIEDYIKKNLTTDYDLIRDEYGVIPMTTKEENSVDGIERIGISSGATRSSTGYTFLNIQKQTDYLAKHLKGIKSENPMKSFRWKILRKMDHILLRIIMSKPKTSKSIIYDMFRKNNTDCLIRFLSDIPTIFDIIRIIANMPKLIFINHAIKSIFSKKV